ncbi:hypothetical protein LTR56_026563 [Elasticomyces elasticus]|nr:hypothetical protein LTR22_028499 [Elasticomyces elasticus]KAK3615477.1 hypothetical protein LTR56_026563 [Elasticomyces elasticus]
MALDCYIERQKHSSRPEHHVLTADTPSTWSSYLPSWKWAPSGARGAAKATKGSSDVGNKFESSGKGGQGMLDVSSFRNPWPSWHKPSTVELWQALEWGEDKDSSIELARSHVMKGKARASGAATPTSTNNDAAELLHITKPIFDFDGPSMHAKTTWLGHATMLVQLPSLSSNERGSDTIIPSAVQGGRLA